MVQGERGAHLIVAPEVAEYICGSLASVRSVPVKNSPIPLAELGVRPPVKKEVRWCVGVRVFYCVLFWWEEGRKDRDWVVAVAACVWQAGRACISTLL